MHCRNDRCTGPAIFFALLVAVCALHSAMGQAQFSTIRTATIDLRYLPGIPERDARKVADFLQSDYDSLKGALGLNFAKRLEVRVYDAIGIFSARTNRTPSWRGAIFVRGVLHVQPVQALEMRNIFRPALSHELAVALLEQAGHKGCPRWLRESFASFHSGSTTAMSPPTGVRLTSFADLEQDLQTYSSPPQRTDVQFVLASTFSYLIRTYGKENAMRLFRSFDGHATLDQVVRNCLGKDVREVEMSWATYIRSISGPNGK